MMSEEGDGIEELVEFVLVKLKDDNISYPEVSPDRS